LALALGGWVTEICSAIWLIMGRIKEESKKTRKRHKPRREKTKQNQAKLSAKPTNTPIEYYQFTCSSLGHYPLPRNQNNLTILDGNTHSMPLLSESRFYYHHSASLGRLIKAIAGRDKPAPHSKGQDSKGQDSKGQDS
jgi:hypothetical protein